VICSDCKLDAGLMMIMGVHSHGQGTLAPVEGSTCPPEGWKLTFGSSLGVQMVQSFQHEGVKRLLIT